MCQIVSDSGFHDFSFGIIDSDIVDLVSRFKTDESAERAVDVVALAGFFSDLAVFGTT